MPPCAVPTLEAFGRGQAGGKHRRRQICRFAIISWAGGAGLGALPELVYDAPARRFCCEPCFYRKRMLKRRCTGTKRRCPPAGSDEGLCSRIATDNSVYPACRADAMGQWKRQQPTMKSCGLQANDASAGYANRAYFAQKAGGNAMEPVKRIGMSTTTGHNKGMRKIT
ncbi:MAG: hypothetical protein ACLSB9_33835 [Hydrogeniiclostridium mannosilyticum]